MKIEYDIEVGAVYVYVADGVHARTLEVVPLEVYVDVDESGRTLGIEFLSFNGFKRHLEEHGGINFPEHFTGLKSLAPERTVVG